MQQLVGSLVLITSAVCGETVVDPPPVRWQAWADHVALAQASPFRQLQWRSVGPRKQGGRIECVTRPPGDSTTIYAGAGSGGLWKSRNNGITWDPIFDDQPTFSIGDVAVDPTDPKTLWVGTGEVLMTRSSYAGMGVFRSADGGASWKFMGLDETHHIARVVVHPSDSNVVYVAAIGHLYSFNAERGIYRTIDGGETWENVLFVDEKTGAIDLVMDPSDPQVLYAAMWQRDRKAWGHVAHGPGSGLYKTTDGGSSWHRLANGLPTGPDVGRIGIDIARTNPHVVYAVVDSRNSDRRGLYRSDNRGATWERVNEERVSPAWDFCIVKVSPDDENEVYLPGQRTYRSTDGGRTFRQIGGTLVHLLPHDSNVLHLDAHALWIDPHNADHLLLGNDGGLHLSYDRGAAWLHLNNLPIGEFYAVSYDMAKPYRIYGGTQDNAALFGPSTHRPDAGGPDPWQQVYLDRWGGGDSYFTLRDPSDADTIYYEHQYGDLRRKNMATGQTARIRPRPAAGEPNLRMNWMTPFVISHHARRTLYYGANRLFKSTDRGDTWTSISDDLTTNPGPDRSGNIPFGTLTSISESPHKPGHLVVGTDDGVIQWTDDDGGTWHRIDRRLPDLWVSRVVSSRWNDRTLYVAMNGYRDDDFSAYLYRSVDGGRHWTSIVANLPAESVNVIAEDPVHDQVLYVGTDLGVYVSIDAGARWHSLCGSLPTAAVHDLFVHPRDGELVIGTHGRSIFVLPVSEIRERAGESSKQ